MSNLPKWRESICSSEFIVAILALAAALCAVVIVFTQSGPANAQERLMVITACETLEELRDTPGSIWETQMIFEGEEAQQIIKAYDSYPPVTYVRAERVMLVVRSSPADEYRHGIAFESDGCSDHRALLTPTVYELLTKETRGQPL